MAYNQFNTNVRGSQNYRVDVTIPAFLLSLFNISLTDKLAQKFSLMCQELEEPKSEHDTIEYGTGTGKAKFAGLTTLNGTLSIKQMKVDDTLSPVGVIDPLVKFGINNLFWLWHYATNAQVAQGPKETVLAKELIAKLTQQTGGRVISPNELVFQSGAGNLPSTYKTSIIVSELASNNAIVESWLYEGCWPKSVGPSSKSRTNSDMLKVEVELEVDNRLPLFLQ